MQPPCDASRSTRRAPPLAVAALLLAAAATCGCAGALPATPEGNSEWVSDRSGELPRRVALRTPLVGGDDPVGRVLGGTLPALGFVVDHEDPQGSFSATVRYADFRPVHLELELRDLASGRVAWRAQVTTDWDMYASVVSATERNTRKALELLRRDLAAGR